MGEIRDTYLRTKKSPDLFWNEYVCRPLAAAVVVAVRKTSVTPNQVTLLSLVVALVSAVALVAWPGHAGLVVAVLVYESSYVLDCADGMLARERGTASPVGHLFDFLMDEIKAFVVLGASVVRLWLERGEPMYLVVGIVGLVALASGVGLTTFVRRPEIAGPEGEAAARASTGALGTLKHGLQFVAHYPSYLWLVALVGRLELFVLPYVVVHALYAVRTLVGVAVRFGRS